MPGPGLESRVTALEATSRMLVDALVGLAFAPEERETSAALLRPELSAAELNLAAREAAAIAAALGRTLGNREAAARLLGVSLRKLSYKLAKAPRRLSLVKVRTGRTA